MIQNILYAADNIINKGDECTLKGAFTNFFNIWFVHTYSNVFVK